MSEIDSQGTQPDLGHVERVVQKLFWLVPIGVVLFTTIVGIYMFKFYGPLSDNTSVWGEFGDFVGGVLNPVFGFLALVALLWTIALQSKELKLSTQELKHSAEALRAQNETLKIQNFEATFFQLLRLHNDIVNNIDMDVNNSVIKGRDCLRFYANRLRQHLSNRQALDDLEKAQETYNIFYEQYQHELGHYFRLLYNIIKLVKTSDIPNKKFYTNLVRAQLSTQELILIFFNCLSPWGEKFKPLVEEFGLLKTLPSERFPAEELKNNYNASAYGISDLTEKPL